MPFNQFFENECQVKYRYKSARTQLQSSDNMTLIAIIFNKA